MTKLLRSWRRSILFRVSILTIALTSVLILVLGTVLSSQITRGVYREKLSASISEADSLVNYTQSQLDATTYRNDIKLKTVLDNLFHLGEVNASVIQREVILLPTPNTAKKSHLYQGSSNFLDFSIIKDDLRIKVRKHFAVQSQFLTIKYLTGVQIDGIAVGSTIMIPNNQEYEIYYLFPLTQQKQLIGLIGVLL